MMKKYFALMALAVIGWCVTSCGGDDGNDGGGGGGGNPTQAGVLDHETGLRITKAGDYQYNYDSEGRLSSVTKSYASHSDYEFTYNPNRVVFEGGDYQGSVGYTGLGYISQIDATYSFVEGKGQSYEATYSGDLNIKYNYDNVGHVVSMTANNNEKKEAAKGNKTRQITTTINLTWQNNRLTQAVVVEKENDSEDGVETYTQTWKFNYTQEDLTQNYNKHHQWVHSVASVFEDDKALAYVGLLGRGPLYLPSSAVRETIEEYEGKREVETDNYTFGYTFNTNGSVNSCKRTKSGSTTTYNYSYGSTGK